MRIRTIKPEFHQHQGLASLPREDRLLAAALLNWADDEGYFQSHPALIAGALFPYDSDGRMFVVRAMSHLAGISYLQMFEGDVGLVTNFLKHQVINKPRKSRLKEKALVDVTDKYRTTPVTLPEESDTEVEVEVEVEQGREVDPPRTRKTSRSAKPPAADKPEEPPNPRHRPMVAALGQAYLEETRGSKYDFQPRDFKEISKLLALTDDDEKILFKWRTALRASFFDQFHTPKTRTLADLVRDWNAYTAINQGASQ